MEGGVRLCRQPEILSREEFPAAVLVLPDLQDAYTRRLGLAVAFFT
jgi:hypothetical protein